MKHNNAIKNNLKVFLCAPRGFCAGVERAVTIVERALEKYGAPLYVRHEIVHNAFVVERLRQKGAIFVNEVNEAALDRPLIFSAHGVSKDVMDQALERGHFVINATCPLVSKVHRDVMNSFEKNHHTLFIGHQGHPEVEGTLGQIPRHAITLIESHADIECLPDSLSDRPLFYTTQTTLSLLDVASLVEALKKRFPLIKSSPKESICYATTNRQQAVHEIINHVEGLIVIGSPNSSNSTRLSEIAQKKEKQSFLTLELNESIKEWLATGIKTIALTSGASAPEVLVESFIKNLKNIYSLCIEEIVSKKENVVFHLPKELLFKRT